MVRLELGLPADLAELGTALGSALTRAQYLSLFANGIATPEQFETSETATLTGCLVITARRVAQLRELLQERMKQQGDEFAPLLPAPTE